MTRYAFGSSPIAVVANTANALSTKGVEAMEAACLEQEQVPCNVIHRFGPGVYFRELTAPAGTFIIGHHQNFEHMNVFLKGRMTLIRDDGSHEELIAPMIFNGKPGRKIAIIHEDITFVNIYSTEETDVEKLEAHFLTKSESFQNSLVEKTLLKLTGATEQADFNLFLIEVGLSAESVRATSINTDDMVALPLGHYKIKLGDSRIEGKGLFATSTIQSGESIAPARVDSKRTIAGRYTNHSNTPNAEMIRSGNDIHLVAKEEIAGCRGGLDGEEITIDYRQAYKLTLKIMEDSLCQQ